MPKDDSRWWFSYHNLKYATAP